MFAYKSFRLWLSIGFGTLIFSCLAGKDILAQECELSDSYKSAPSVYVYEPSTLVLIVDRSGSMKDEVEKNGTKTQKTRWDVAKEALNTLKPNVFEDYNVELRQLTDEKPSYSKKVEPSAGNLNAWLELVSKLGDLPNKSISSPLLQVLAGLKNRKGLSGTVIFLSDGIQWTKKFRNKVPFTTKKLKNALRDYSEKEFEEKFGYWSQDLKDVVNTWKILSIDYRTAEPESINRVIPPIVKVERSPSPLELYGHQYSVAVGGKNGWYCSGVLIAKNWVLTARHCLPATHVAQGENAKRASKIIKISSVHLPKNKNHDVVLLKLKSKFKLDFPVRFRPKLPDEPSGTALQIGYGRRDIKAALDGKRKNRTLPVQGWQCDSRSSMKYQCTPGLEMVIAANDGRDTCAGDSGSPVFLPQLIDNECVPILIGIASRGTPSKTACGAGGIYTRADVLKKWISRTIKKNQIKSKKRRSKP